MTHKSFETLCMLAAKGHLQDIVDAVNLNPDLVSRTSPGHNRTLLWVATRNNRRDVVEYLLSQGADVNIPGRIRSESFVLIKPFCVAMRYKRSVIATLLSQYGNILDPFSMAYLGMLEPLKKLIIHRPQLVNREQTEDKIWRVTPLHFALSGGHIAVARMLIEQGAVIQQHSALLLDIASRRKRKDLVELLCKAGADAALAPPYSVILSDSTEILEMSLHAGLDINNRNDSWPVLVYICRGDKGEHPERVERLLQYGADVNIRAIHGFTALHVAARAGFNKVIRVLLENGSDLSAESDTGKTALDFAIAARQDSTISLLQNWGIQ